MADFTKEFLERTIEVWQPRYDHPLTLDDAREIAETVIALFEVLDSLDKKYES
jgi:hypothetical protein